MMMTMPPRTKTDIEVMPTKKSLFLRRGRRILYCFLALSAIVGGLCFLRKMSISHKKIALIKTIPTMPTKKKTTTMVTTGTDDEVANTSFHFSFSSLWTILMERASLNQLDRIEDDETKKTQEKEVMVDMEKATKDDQKDEEEEEKVDAMKQIPRPNDESILPSSSSSSSTTTTNLVDSKIYKPRPFVVESHLKESKAAEEKVFLNLNDKNIRFKFTATKDDEQYKTKTKKNHRHGIFGFYDWNKWNELIIKLSRQINIYFTSMGKKNEIARSMIEEEDNNDSMEGMDYDDQVSYSTTILLKHVVENESDNKNNKDKNNKDNKEEYHDDKIGNLRVSNSNHQNLHDKSHHLSTLLTPKLTKTKHTPNAFNNKAQDDSNLMDRDHYDVRSYYDLDEFNRLLQTGGGGGGGGGTSTTTSTPICSNISDTFKTTYVLLVQGNESLFTETQANLLAATFATSYNDQRNSNTGGGGGTTVCDPLFRTITQVEVSANVSFTGVSQGQIIDNPLPMRPVRGRKLQSPLYDQYSYYHGQHQSSTTMGDWNLWKSSHLEFQKIMKKIKEEEEDGGDTMMIIGHHPQEEERQLQQKPNSTSLDRFPSNSRVLLMLLDIYGTCRGCQGQAQAFNLFDDTSSPSSPVVRRKGRRRQEQYQERHLQDNQATNEDNGDGTPDCICPADSVVGDSTDFQSSFNSNVEDLRESGEIDFVEQVEEVIPVLETKCPTKDQDFSTVVLTTDVVFSQSILFSSRGGIVQEVELLFRDSYNGISQQLCDPLYRAITKNQLVSIEQEEQGSTKVRMEFVVDATCRGDNCIEVGCIFDDTSSCGVDQSERNLKNNFHDSTSSIVPEEMTDTSPISSSRLLKDDDDEERCFCRKGRSNRPPTPQEFQEAFQKGLNDITENNKLSSCQECSFPFDCQSGVCFTGRCAEADTQLLINACTCNSNEECESGFCEDTSSTGENDGGGEMFFSGTCQGKLASCRVCNNGEECLSGVCTGGRCAEAIDGKLKTGCECSSNLNCRTGRCVDNFINTGVPGKCTEKISNTCNEPCLSSTDCLSGLCGSVVCMPVNGTLLPDGCLSTLRTECESAMLENNICIPASEAPSFEPSVKPTLGPTFQPSLAPSTIPSSGPSTGPSHGPTTGPSKEPSTPPTFEPSTGPSSGPSTGPSWTPSTPPTTGPSQSPSTPPTTQPSQSPSISPSASPTMVPSSSPSITPTTPFPSFSPSSSPSTSSARPPGPKGKAASRLTRE